MLSSFFLFYKAQEQPHPSRKGHGNRLEESSHTNYPNPSRNFSQKSLNLHKPAQIHMGAGFLGDSRSWQLTVTITEEMEVMKKRDIGKIEPRSEQLKLESSQGRRDQQLCVLSICAKENLITYILFMLKIICTELLL